ncbi:MAG TPA: NlpC/P60 family protein [Gaiellaceae bacterium]|nr:NlpC/P60 family protein [Gaiellaceae bacterium]
MRLVRTTIVLTCTILLLLTVTPPAPAANPIAAQRAHATRVEAKVNAMGIALESVIQRWDGERAALVQVNTRLREANHQLHIARTNLHAAQHQLEQRLVQLYVSPPPDAIDVLVGAKSLSDLINRIESTQSFSRQDRAIAAAALRFRTQVGRRKRQLQREQRNRERLISQLNAEHTRIENGIAEQKRLLATIHQTISTLQAQAAARARRRAAAERTRIARQVALARREAAAQAVQPQPTVVLPAPPQPPPSPEQTANPAAPAPEPAPAPPPQPTTHATAASIAARYLGVPYVWGGASPGGFDCSGLVMYVYAQLGVSLPHYTVSQWNATTPIPTSALAPGDLVFFDGLSHVGIYIGNGQFIHAPHTGTVVQIGSLSGYWAAHLDGARRVPG